MSRLNRRFNFKEYNRKAVDRIESLLDKLGVEYQLRKYNNTVHIKCPLHNSEYIDHASLDLGRGIFSCWSDNCHEQDHVNKTVIGFIRGCLSLSSGSPAPWRDVMNFIDNETNINPVEYTSTTTRDIHFLEETTHPPDVITPSKYYINRGFDDKILRANNIGDSPWWEKAIIPVRYYDGRYMGFTGRSINTECQKCHMHHSKYSACIDGDTRYICKYLRWYHKGGMTKEFTLYNLDRVVKQDTNKIAIVEGPSCCWKLEEYGIWAAATLGKDFGEFRKDLLVKLGLTNILFLSDNDDSGKKFRSEFITKYKDVFNIVLPGDFQDKKDPSAMNDDEIKRAILAKWDKI